ncbi:MAG: hypothetical protein ACOYUZ_03400 [Patescibacteria group bacterium]
MKKRKIIKRKSLNLDIKEHAHNHDINYWMKHVIHWHLSLLVIIFVIAFIYLLFDPSAPAWARINPVSL